MEKGVDRGQGFVERDKQEAGSGREMVGQIDERLDQMEGVEEELPEGERVEKETVDRYGNRETENGKMDGENGRMGEDVEVEGEK